MENKSFWSFICTLKGAAVLLGSLGVVFSAISKLLGAYESYAR